MNLLRIRREAFNAARVVNDAIGMWLAAQLGEGEPATLEPPVEDPYWPATPAVDLHECGETVYIATWDLSVVMDWLAGVLTRANDADGASLIRSAAGWLRTNVEEAP
ncbi:MAG: hypothetical protein ACQSGP_23730 [Frankia sp.]